MDVKIRFLGAAKNVTGSRYYLEVDDLKILVDCGLYQERKYRYRNWEPFVFPPAEIDYILLTHAHIDHSGLLPKIVREGFKGRIYCTLATADISKIMLLDSAKLQEEDAGFKRKRHKKEGRKVSFPEEPLYKIADAEDTLPLFSGVHYKQPVHLADGVKATFYEAGHVFGSSMIVISIDKNDSQKKILFSGDVGRWHQPIIKDPTLFTEADYVIVESTYGDRIHESVTDIDARLAGIINSTLNAGGKIVVPSFALERTQDLLYHLNELHSQNRIPDFPVLLDSPMAISITEVFKEHPYLYDSETIEMLKNNHSPFDLPGLKMVRSVEESKTINSLAKPAMIVAGSGMCTGGRIKYHLADNISRPQSTVLFIGYQAFGTLGREIVEGAEQVRILGQHYPVKARVEQIQGFSAHADRDDLLRWLTNLTNPPRKVFITHGEPEVAENFRRFLEGKTGWDIKVPEYRSEFILD